MEMNAVGAGSQWLCPPEGRTPSVAARLGLNPNARVKARANPSTDW